MLLINWIINRIFLKIYLIGFYIIFSHPSMNFTSSTILKLIGMNSENSSGQGVDPLNSDLIFIFDIDDTLYKASEEMHNADMNAWKTAYDKYKHKNSNTPDFSTFIELSDMYCETFRSFFDVKYSEVEKTRNFNYKTYLKKDENLYNYLKKFPYRKWCFTNATKYRAVPILHAIGLDDCFEGIIHIDDDCKQNCSIGKPSEEAFLFIEKIFNIKDKKKIYFFDDLEPNINTGIKMGWNCYLIKREDSLIDVLDKVLANLSENGEI